MSTLDCETAEYKHESIVTAGILEKWLHMRCGLLALNVL